MHELDIAEVIDFARRWADLGAAVTDQVVRALDDPGCGSCWDDGTEHGVNPAAIRLAHERLRGLHEGIGEALADFLDATGPARWPPRRTRAPPPSTSPACPPAASRACARPST